MSTSKETINNNNEYQGLIDLVSKFSDEQLENITKIINNEKLKRKTKPDNVTFKDLLGTFTGVCKGIGIPGPKGSLFTPVYGDGETMGLEIKYNNGETIVIPTIYKEVKFSGGARGDGFIRVSTDGKNRGLLNMNGDVIVKEGKRPELKFLDTSVYTNTKFHKDGYTLAYDNVNKKYYWINNKGEFFDFDTNEKLG